MDVDFDIENGINNFFLFFFLQKKVDLLHDILGFTEIKQCINRVGCIKTLKNYNKIYSKLCGC